MDEDETWHGGEPLHRPPCVRWGSRSPSPKGHSLQFSSNVCCGQTAGWIKMPVGMKVCFRFGPGHIVLHGDPAQPPKGAQPPIFGRCLLSPNGRPSQLLLSTCYHYGNIKVSFKHCEVQCKNCTLKKCVCGRETRGSFTMHAHGLVFAHK